MRDHWDASADVTAEVGPDTTDTWDAPPRRPDSRDAGDAVDVQVEDTRPDTGLVDPWEPEEVEPSVPLTQALTDRTSLAVDPDGTIWLGYHACDTFGCDQPTLDVTHKPVGGNWTRESIRQHDGLFGVSVIDAGEPIVVFPDTLDRTYKAAMRQPDGHWRMYTFPVARGGSSAASDGFDVTHNQNSYFVSFASGGARQVEFYAYDTTAASPAWRPRASLPVRNPQAAMERGLRADGGDSVYLVNRRGTAGAYGVYRYDEQVDAWPQSVELDRYTDTFVHSLYITDDFHLCMSGDYRGNLLVTCGSMFDLTQQTKYFAGQPLANRHPSSIIEGDDGALYVAYNPANNDELRVARRAPRSGAWTVETVFDGSSYGVSTAIGHSGDLVVSFYTCNDADRCSLQLLRETPPQ